MGKSTINGHFQYQSVKLPEGNIHQPLSLRKTQRRRQAKAVGGQSERGDEVREKMKRDFAEPWTNHQAISSHLNPWHNQWVWVDFFTTPPKRCFFFFFLIPCISHIYQGTGVHHGTTWFLPIYWLRCNPTEVDQSCGCPKNWEIMGESWEETTELLVSFWWVHHVPTRGLRCTWPMQCWIVQDISCP